MNKMPPPPEQYKAFITKYPELGEAWQAVMKAGGKGPLDAKAVRLIKLGIAIGSMRRSAVRSAVRKSLGEGIAREEFEQVVALAAGSLGMPSAVAVNNWIDEILEEYEGQ